MLQAVKCKYCQLAFLNFFFLELFVVVVFARAELFALSSTEKSSMLSLCIWTTYCGSQELLLPCSGSNIDGHYLCKNISANLSCAELLLLCCSPLCCSRSPLLPSLCTKSQNALLWKALLRAVGWVDGLRAAKKRGMLPSPSEALCTHSHGSTAGAECSYTSVLCNSHFSVGQ